MNPLLLLSKKIDELIKYNKALVQENLRLQKMLNKKAKEVEDLSQSSHHQQQAMLINYSAKAMRAAGDEELMKAALDQTIAQIEQLMAQLKKA